MAKRTRRIPVDKIQAILAEHTGGKTVAEITKLHGISPATFYNWKNKYGSSDGAPAKRGRPKKVNKPKVTTFEIGGRSPAQTENANLRGLLIDVMLENKRLREQISSH